MMRYRLIRPAVLALGFVLVAVVQPKAGWAQEEPDSATMSDKLEEEQEQSSFQQGPSVRRKILYRSTRFEAAPMVAVTSGDAFLRDAVFGASFNYYLTNAVGIGATVGYAPLHLETNLANNVKQSLNQNNSGALDSLKFSYTQWLAGLEFIYVPLFGKFTIMNASTLQYDLHLIGGLTMVGRGVCRANDVNTACAANPASGNETSNFNNGANPAGTIGLGFRLFVADAYALNLQVRDHLYRRALVGTGSAEPEFANNLLVNLGFSFFFPQSVKISR